ncbi:DUF6086 family protein [Kutzneria buriramensis]|uniref:Uncharacterized protein n=1 Tax=Kutzneria buriramensis TaxID=1045776 RepID=A0A3E0HEW5_9PSEU|nr:DUF6086 family protein [Kutzneria buriramensis]REH43782.1 hypothetical protein BCF44_109325 [Kutzneria buriramensis]
MSQYFELGDRTLWNPSNGVGLLFVRTAKAMEPVVDLPCGIEPSVTDEWAINLPTFERFVHALADRYQRSTHLILRGLTEGFIATAMVVLERAGGEAPPEPAADAPMDNRDVSPGGARAESGRLVDLRDRYDRVMPS